MYSGRKILNAVGLLLSLSTVTWCSASAQAPLAPLLKVGDTWVIDSTTTNRVFPNGKRRITVTSIEDNRYVLSTEPIDGANVPVSTTMLTDELVTVKNPYGPVTKTCARLKFPLEIGKKWTIDCEFPRPDGEPNTLTASVKVVAFEEVVVPAGRFKAYKVEAEGRWGRPARGSSGRVYFTEWFSLDAKTIVKSEYNDFNSNGSAGNNGSTQLIEFKLN